MLDQRIANHLHDYISKCIRDALELTMGDHLQLVALELGKASDAIALLIEFYQVE